MSMSVSQAGLQSAVELLRRAVPSLLAVYHYGSTAHGFDRAQSDVDLGILAGTPLARELLWDLAPQLEEIVGRDVDLAELSRATPVLLMQVLAGKLMYSSDPQQVARFENLAMSRYCRLNQERKEILEDIAARGSIYA
jgi:uncharacterized protein